jgi:tRNA A-37 threonylcarbamoyl transferase component Bud32
MGTQVAKGTNKALLVPGLALCAGDVLAGRYRVEEQMEREHEGALGIVLAATQLHTRQPVAVRILTSYTESQAAAVARRIARARVASRMRSEHVAKILDVGTTPEGVAFVVSQRFEGTTLEHQLDHRARVPVEEAVGYVLEACEAVAEGHALGLVHGGLRPSNMLLARPEPANARARMRAEPLEAPPVLKLLDFGTSGSVDEDGEDGSQTWLGSPVYLAPEQIQDPGNVDARADVWALGVVLFELISGGLPFTAETLSGVLVSIVCDAAPLLGDAPYPLAKLVHKCLSKDRSMRPRDVAALARELAPFTPGGEALADRVAAALETPPASARRSGGARAAAPASPAQAASARVGSIPPVAYSLEPEAPADEPTHPSLERLARSRKRAVRLTAFALAVGGLAVVVAATLTVTGPIVGGDDAPLAVDAVGVTPSKVEPPAVAVPAAEVHAVPAAEVHAAEPATSAATPSDATSHATLPRPRLVPVRPATPVRALRPTRLPPGLPSTRVPLPERMPGERK